MKKRYLILGIITLFLSVSLPLTASTLVLSPSEAESRLPKAAINSKFYSGNGNNLDLSLLQVGDIIAVSGVKWGDGALPGHFTHTAIYVGGGLIVEAMPEGVRYSYVDIVHGADDAAIVRVSTYSWVKEAAADFCEAQVGKPYDYIWLTWIGGKDENSYYWYCSELNWAGYYHYGVDIDDNPGWSWTYGYNVAPQEIPDDGNTWIVQHAY